MTTLRVILPDQLDRTLLDRIRPREGDRILMAETGYLFTTSTHRRKLALLASAGRHFAAQLQGAGFTVSHATIAQDSHQRPLREHIERIGSDPLRIVAVRPGSWSELEELTAAAESLQAELVIEEDPHFFSTPDEFAEHAAGRKRLVMEYFYRELRKRESVLIEDGEPAGGEWNYDEENRESFGKEGPPETPPAPRHEPDEITRNAISDVETQFSEAPGSLTEFAHAVTPEQAQIDLEDFVANRLARFGQYQDAMWTGRPFLYHSLLSPSLNLRLLDPRTVVSRAEAAWSDGSVPLNSAEGFIRQILGWREFVRGVYYYRGSDYLEENALEAHHELPRTYWDGESRMRCVADVMGGILRHGYANHIQRLMVMGLYAMQYGADPAELHDWHLSLYLDAYDWASAPNVIGMSQYADDGFLATKPYAASGRYINRMSNYCRECPFSPDKATGEDACPFTTFYWDFLHRHRDRLKSNRRMALQLHNLDRKSSDELAAITDRARELRKENL